MKKLLKSRYTVRLFFSFVLMLLIPLSSVGISYREANRMVTENAKNYTYAMLEQIQRILESQWEQFDTIAYNLSQESSVRNFLYAPPSLSNMEYYRIWEIQQEMIPYGMAEDYLVDIGLYFRRSGRFISINTVGKEDTFYNTYFKNSDISQSELFFHLDNPPSEGFFLPQSSLLYNGQDIPLLSYVSSIPVGHSNLEDGFLIFFVNGAKISSILEEADVFQNGNVYLLDQHQQQISGAEGNPKLVLEPEDLGPKSKSFERRGKNIVAYITSPSRGWKYVVKIPFQSLMNDAYYLKLLLLLLVVATLLAGGILAALLSARNVKPLVRVTKTLAELMDTPQDHMEGRDEYAYIQGSIKQLVEQNSVLSDTLLQQQPVLKSVFLGALFRGEYANQEDIQETLSNVGLIIPGNYYTVLMMAPQPVTEELSLSSTVGNARMAAVLAWEKELADRAHCHLWDQDKVAVLIGLDNKEESGFFHQVEQAAFAVRTRLLREYELSFSIYGGTVCTSLSQIYTSFLSAKNLCDYNWNEELSETVSWCSHSVREEDGYSYPINMQQRLINLALVGKEQEVLELLHFIYKENYRKRNLSKSDQIQLLMEMRGTLLRLYERIRLDPSEIGVSIQECAKAEEGTYGHLQEEYQRICQTVNEMRDNKTLKVKEMLLDYLKEQYRDPNLSLTSIGERFQMGEAALSQFFKENTGQTLSVYVENLRIQEACTLLQEPGKERKSIFEIASMVGYNNDKSFRRAFKRVVGVSPTEYRKLHTNKD